MSYQPRKTSIPIPECPGIGPVSLGIRLSGYRLVAYQSILRERSMVTNTFPPPTSARIAAYKHLSSWECDVCHESGLGDDSTFYAEEEVEHFLTTGCPGSLRTNLLIRPIPKPLHNISSDPRIREHLESINTLRPLPPNSEKPSQDGGDKTNDIHIS